MFDLERRCYKLFINLYSA